MRIIDLSHNSDTASFLGDKRAEINVSQNWLAEIDSGIEAANTFLFAISPDSLLSKSVPRRSSM